MRKEKLFLILAGVSAGVFLFDIGYIVYTVVRWNTLVQGKNILTDSFRQFGLAAIGANAAVLFIAAVYLLLRRRRLRKGKRLP